MALVSESGEPDAQERRDSLRMMEDACAAAGLALGPMERRLLEALAAEPESRERVKASIAEGRWPLTG
jgi:hypothetical protein